MAGAVPAHLQETVEEKARPVVRPGTTGRIVSFARYNAPGYGLVYALWYAR
jgi:hypothetical protein